MILRDGPGGDGEGRPVDAAREHRAPRAMEPEKRAPCPPVREEHGTLPRRKLNFYIRVTREPEMN